MVDALLVAAAGLKADEALPPSLQNRRGAGGKLEDGGTEDNCNSTAQLVSDMSTTRSGLNSLCMLVEYAFVFGIKFRLLLMCFICNKLFLI